MSATQTISAAPCTFKPESATVAELACHGCVLKIVLNSPGVTAPDFYSQASPCLDDVLASKGAGDSALVLLVLPFAGTTSVFICGISGEGRNWEANVIVIRRPRAVDTSYALPDNPDQFTEVQALHRSFSALVGRQLFTARPPEGTSLLRVKVHPGEHWFLRYPLGAFARFAMNGFENTSGVQWIVSNRTITEVANSQQAAETEMNSTAGFFQGTRIILNTYRVHSEAADAHLLNAALDLFFDVAGCLQDLTLRGSQMSLHWTLNPDLNELSRLLLAPQTRYVFADFEAEDGTWHTGEGEHRCNQSCGHQPATTGALIDLAYFRGRLEHVRALKIFHCNSLYDPYNPAVNPADEGTIAAALLSTGAYFVDASSTAESPVDYTCTLLKTLLDRSDIRTILWTKSLAGQCNDAQLISRANSFLGERGFNAINSN